MASSMARQCCSELAALAEKLLEKVPDKNEWSAVRHFLQNTTTLLRSKNLNEGVVNLQRVLPYIEKAIHQMDKYLKVSDTCQITETITDHFLVSDQARIHLENFIQETKVRLLEVKASIELFTEELDRLLVAVVTGKTDVSFMTAVQMTFKINRISGSIRVCENRMLMAREMIDSLDTHVASKNFVANLFSAMCILASFVFSASGNVPLGAACLATATASRRSAQGLAEYRRQLSRINNEHDVMQAELTEWTIRFQIEQRNFLLLFGAKYAALFIISVFVILLIFGKTANFIIFAFISVFFVYQADNTKGTEYYVGTICALAAVLAELLGKSNGLAIFNVFAVIAFTVKVFGFLNVI